MIATSHDCEDDELLNSIINVGFENIIFSSTQFMFISDVTKVSNRTSVSMASFPGTSRLIHGKASPSAFVAVL